MLIVFWKKNLSCQDSTFEAPQQYLMQQINKISITFCLVLMLGQFSAHRYLGQFLDRDLPNFSELDGLGQIFSETDTTRK